MTDRDDPNPDEPNPDDPPAALDATGQPPGDHPGNGLARRGGDGSPLLFQDLEPPSPIDPDPPPAARWLAFGSILVAGLLGGLIGYGTGDLMGGSTLWAAIGALVGAAICAVGVGVVAALTLRAMSEWKAVEHRDSETRRSSGLIIRPADEEADGADRSADGPPDGHASP